MIYYNSENGLSRVVLDMKTGTANIIAIFENKRFINMVII